MSSVSPMHEHGSGVRPAGEPPSARMVNPYGRTKGVEIVHENHMSDGPAPEPAPAPPRKRGRPRGQPHSS